MGGWQIRMALAAGPALLLGGCVAGRGEVEQPDEPLALHVSVTLDEAITARYTMVHPTRALHFAQELGGYRAARWQPSDDGFRWVKEGEGERIERRDGAAFDAVGFTIAIDYRALPKSYAPFSPFSEGSTLIHSGQFHACLQAPCAGKGALPLSVDAPGRIVGLEGRRTPGHDRFVSREEGTNIFVGSLEPVAADGFVAIIDPGLPGALRQHLSRSLPASIDHFASIYGRLSFTPELYVSIDDRPEANGGLSTQGGTLPNQIFIHFDGENAKQRAVEGSPFWLDWFFAHEAAHLFQQDRGGSLGGDDASAWLHEGGADAMAALALLGRGEAESAYVRQRLSDAETACARGLAEQPLNEASAAGAFDLHYQCGLVIWLAFDRELRAAGHEGLDDLNRAFWAKVRSGRPWSAEVLLTAARELGAREEVLAEVSAIAGGDSADIAGLGRLARESLAGGAGA